MTGVVEMEDVAAELIAQARERLADIRRRMVTTLGRLSSDELAWRPNAESNSAANLVVHVCGNLRQRFHAGFGGAADDRDRDAEFAEGTAAGRSASELSAMVEETFGLVDRFLSGLAPARLGETLVLQGRPQTLLEALLRTVGHSAEHLGEIIYIAKAQLGAGFETLSIPRPRP